MTHDEARTLLPSAAIDSLDADEQTALLEHLAHCPDCAEQLDALRHLMAQLAFATPLEPVSAETHQRIRARLAERATADRE